MWYYDFPSSASNSKGGSRSSQPSCSYVTSTGRYKVTTASILKCRIFPIQLEQSPIPLKVTYVYRQCRSFRFKIRFTCKSWPPSSTPGTKECGDDEADFVRLCTSRCPTSIRLSLCCKFDSERRRATSDNLLHSSFTLSISSYECNLSTNVGEAICVSCSDAVAFCRSATFRIWDHCAHQGNPATYGNIT